MFVTTIPARPTACADKAELMFDPLRTHQAKALCAGCWFAPQCAEISKDESWGVWAGEVKYHTLGERVKLLTDVIVDAYDRGEITPGGNGTARLSEQFGITFATVRTVLNRERPNRTTEQSDQRAERNARILSLSDEGWTNKDIAAELQIGRQIVQRVVAAQKHAA